MTDRNMESDDEVDGLSSEEKDVKIQNEYALARVMKETREELNLSMQLLTSILDNPIEGLSEIELDNIRRARAQRMLTAARKFEAAVRGETLTLRANRGDEVPK